MKPQLQISEGSSNTKSAQLLGTQHLVNGSSAWENLRRLAFGTDRKGAGVKSTIQQAMCSTRFWNPFVEILETPDLTPFQ